MFITVNSSAQLLFGVVTQCVWCEAAERSVSVSPVVWCEAAERSVSVSPVVWCEAAGRSVSVSPVVWCEAAERSVSVSPVVCAMQPAGPATGHQDTDFLDLHAVCVQFVLPVQPTRSIFVNNICLLQHCYMFRCSHIIFREFLMCGKVTN